MRKDSTRQLQRLETWRAIQAAALELVDEFGVSAVFVDAIAARAGVARRTFFNHFDTKVAALFDPDPVDTDYLDELLAAAVVGGGDYPWIALKEVCGRFSENRDSVLRIRKKLILQDEALIQYHRAAHIHVEKALLAWATAQLPGDRFMAAMMAGTAGGIMIAAFDVWRVTEPPEAFSALIREGFDSIPPCVFIRAVPPA
jgi:AcrR family transcriptional regulator